jgi:cytoskeletal protein CcmA (bactofilin family)
MFRRKEDGSDATDTETISTSEAAVNTSANPPSAASAPAAPAVSTPIPANAPAAHAAPSFRPAPPQAAMAAANRPATPVNAPSSAPTVAATPVSQPERVPASPIGRPTSKRVLTVGPDIQMKGEIASCDRVIIEGTVDATMRDVHTVELAETGTLKGTAEVEDAEISGAFEGDLTVRGRLTVHASGRVRGNVTYGEIEIQRGGQISGNIRNIADAKTGANSNEQQHKPKAA